MRFRATVINYKDAARFSWWTAQLELSGCSCFPTHNVFLLSSPLSTCFLFFRILLNSACLSFFFASFCEEAIRRFMRIILLVCNPFTCYWHELSRYFAVPLLLYSNRAVRLRSCWWSPLSTCLPSLLSFSTPLFEGHFSLCVCRIHLSTPSKKSCLNFFSMFLSTSSLAKRLENPACLWFAKLLGSSTLR